MQIPPPSENSEEKQTEMFQFVEKLMVEEIEADLNDHSEWLKIGSVFKIHYLVYHNYVKPGLHISEAIKTAPPPPSRILKQIVQDQTYWMTILNEHPLLLVELGF